MIISFCLHSVRSTNPHTVFSFSLPLSRRPRLYVFILFRSHSTHFHVFIVFKHIYTSQCLLSLFPQATQYTLGHVQWLRALRRIVMRLNPRGFLPDPSKTNSTVNPQCFSDTMDFVNAIAGTQMMTDNPMDLNFTDYGWVVSSE